MCRSRFFISNMLLLVSFFSFGQKGKNNAGVITAPGTIINTYAALTNSVSAGAVSFAVTNAAGIVSGDLLMIIQMQGATITSANDSTWGSIRNYNSSGWYEFSEVLAVAGNNITLSCPLKHGYTSTGKTQIIKVPRYTSLTIPANGEISSAAWDGSTGGILVAEVSGDISINGTINVSGKGFRPGFVDQQTNFNCNDYASPNEDAGAEKGEGIAGFGPDYTIYGGRYGRGAPANGGGGGNCHNAGGGGGSNAGKDVYTGNGNPDFSDPSWDDAWKLEYPGLLNTVSSGGGKGGPTFSMMQLDPLTVGQNNPSWQGDFRRSVGGKGGRPLDYSSGRLFLGGGGGAGDANNNSGGNGGNGGGMVFLIACGKVSGGGAIIANGLNGEDTKNVGNDAAGGGGGGGTIILNAGGGVSGVSLTANGGNGGNQSINYVEGEGPGGGGGGGYIAVTSGAVLKRASGGLSGITTSPIFVEFTPNYATMGGKGISDAVYNEPVFSLITKDTSICKGNPVTLRASFQGTPPADATISWYKTNLRTSLISSGPSLTTAKLYKDTVFYVTFCPYNCSADLIPVHVKVGRLDVADAGPDTAVCSGVPVLLGVPSNPAYTYQWTPPAGLNYDTIASPVFQQTNTGDAPVKYPFSLIVKGFGCVDTDEVVVTVNPFPLADAGRDTVICSGNKVVIGGPAHPDYTYTWRKDPGQDSFNVSNPSPTLINTTNTPAEFYFYLTTEKYGCQSKDTAVVTVNPLPVANAGKDTAVCSGIPFLVGAAPVAGYTYEWAPVLPGTNPSQATLVFANSGNVPIVKTYSLVTRFLGCSNVGSVKVTINPYPVADAGADDTVCFGTSKIVGASANSNYRYRWTPSGNLSNDTIYNPVFKASVNPAVDKAYSYTLKVLLYGCEQSDEVTIVVKPAPTAYAGRDTMTCEKIVETLGRTGTTGVQYQWTPSLYLDNPDIPQPLVEIENTGHQVIHQKYTVKATGGGCSAEDDVTVSVYPAITPSVSRIGAICQGENVELTASGGENYVWNTDERTATIIVSPVKTTLYHVYIENVCKAEDTVTVIVKNNENQVVYVPNSFSPGGRDDINRIFKAEGEEVKNLRGYIFNRWGDQIYEWGGIDNGWNGYLDGALVQIDVYIYRITTQDECGKKKFYNGTVSVIR